MTKINSDYQQKNIVFTKKRPPNTQSVNQKWSKDAITKLFSLSFNDLLFRAHTIHRENFDPNSVQLSTLLSIKTEDVRRTAVIVHNLQGITQRWKILPF